MAFLARRVHSDVHEVNTKRLLTCIKVEETAHGLALLLDRSFHRYRIAEELFGLLHQKGNLGLRRSRECAVFVRPAQSVPDDQCAGHHCQSTKNKYRFHRGYSFRALAFSVAWLALSKNGSNL